MLFCCSCIAIAIGIALLYALFDVNHYIRAISTVLFARFFQKKINVLDASRIYGKQGVMTQPYCERAMRRFLLEYSLDGSR
jgi:hypothetical protein